MSERVATEHGSALLLLPAGVLIVLLLGAMAVDTAVAFLAERELADVSAAAANDAATTALDEGVFYACGRLVIAAEEARSVAATAVAARVSDAVDVTHVAVTVHNDRSPPEVAVTVSGTVDLVFTMTLPGRSRTTHVEARATAVPETLGVPDEPAATC